MRSDPVAPAHRGELDAPAGWGTIDFVSDLHLQASEPGTARAFCGYLRTCAADALFILGDLFEVWIGDDLLTAGPALRAADPEYDFLAAICAELRVFSARHRLFVLHGNRDFLLGPGFAAASGAKLLEDPTLLRWRDQRLLLSHGDALCLEDSAYLAFRTQVRAEGWQQAFLARPLSERAAFARSLRTQSEARKQDPAMEWADVDHRAAVAWLRAGGADTLVHGHTHRPGRHDLDDGLQRLVLSDWDAAAKPPRAELLRLDASGWRRVPLAG